MNDIYDLCKKFTKKENVEFIYNKSYKESANISEFGLSKTNNSEFEAMSIRVLENGKIGLQTITKITEKNISKGIIDAKKFAKLKKSPKINSFGSDKSNIKIKSDKELDELKLSEILPELKKEITKEKYFRSYEGSISKRQSYEMYINPYTENEDSGSSLSLGVMINTNDKTPSSGSFGSIFSKRSDVDVKKVLDQAKYNANLLINPKSGDKKKYTLIFIPEVTHELFSLIISATIGENIYKKQSYLYDQLNKKIFSKNITIVEDPHIDYFLGSCVLDDEGFKTRKKEIIKNGVFKKIIYDQQQAVISKTQPTGNGFKPDMYSQSVSGYTNILQTPGKESINDIISKTKNGILVFGVMGIHTSNLTTGEFSLVINQGKEIIDGKLKNTITNLNFTGNCKTMFKDIYFSKEQMFFGSSCYSFGVIENVNLI